MRIQMERAIAVLKYQGLVMLLFKLYGQFIRQKLPTTESSNTISMGGVDVQLPEPRLFDSIIGMPYYESWEADFVEEYLTEGDTVVEIGTGFGTTTVKAAQRVGEDGSVTSYEASPTAFRIAQDTIQRNGIADRVTLHQQAVAAETSIRYNEESGEIIEVIDLPNCTALILDCEGAEIPILRRLNQSPNLIIVESHSGLGAPHGETRELLESDGYNIEIDVMGEPTGHLVATI